MQGYGLTETCATGTIMDVHDAVGVEIVGPPLNGVHIKLRSWEEGKRVAIVKYCNFVISSDRTAISLGATVSD